MTKPVSVKVCSICNTKKSLVNFHKSGRRRKTDGVMPYRAACTVCERKRARERHDRIRENRAIRKCPTCDNAMASNGTGSQAGLRENRARLHSGELLQLALDIRAMMEHLPGAPHPLLAGVASRAAIVLTKVMGRRWAEKEEEKVEDTERQDIPRGRTVRTIIYEKQRHHLAIESNKRE